MDDLLWTASGLYALGAAAHLPLVVYACRQSSDVPPVRRVVIAGFLVLVWPAMPIGQLYKAHKNHRKGPTS